MADLSDVRYERSEQTKTRIVRGSLLIESVVGKSVRAPVASRLRRVTCFLP